MLQNSTLTGINYIFFIIKLPVFICCEKSFVKHVNAGTWYTFCRHAVCYFMPNIQSKPNSSDGHRSESRPNMRPISSMCPWLTHIKTCSIQSTLQLNLLIYNSYSKIQIFCRQLPLICIMVVYFSSSAFIDFVC